MKPLLPLTLLALLLTAAAWSAEKANSPHIYVNGLPLRSASGGPAAALVKDGVTYVPLRAVSEALGCTVDYSPRSGVFIWGGPLTPQDPNSTLRSPQGEAGPNAPSGLPTPGLPRDPRPVIPQPPLPGRP